MKKGSAKGEGQVEWRRIGLGTGVGAIGMLTMTGLGAWLLERELIGLEWVNYLAAAILLVSSFLGAKTAGASVERWIGPGITALGLLLILVLIHGLIFGGGMEGISATALPLVAGSGAAILLGGRGRGGKRRSRRSRIR